MRSFAWYSKFLHGCILVSHGIRSEIAGCQISSLILFLAYLIGLAKGYEAPKHWILHVIELQLSLPWTTQNSPSFLACFNDKKATKNTKTCQKLISNKGPYVPIELKGINYYSKVFKTVNFKL